jgi:hypothetical protein
MLSLVLSLELLSLITYHLSSNHSTGSRLRNVSNTKSSLSHTIHFSFPNPLISVPLSLYNHLALPTRLPLSHFPVHLSLLPSNSLPVLSAILPLYFGMISPLPCANLPKNLPPILILIQIQLTHNLWLSPGPSFTQQSRLSCSPALTPTMPPLTFISLTARPTLLSSWYPLPRTDLTALTLLPSSELTEHRGIASVVFVCTLLCWCYIKWLLFIHSFRGHNCT